MSREIDTSSWGEFNVLDLFDRIERGKGSGAGAFVDGDVPYIAASFVNNGYVRDVEDFDGSLTSDGNCIALICNGNGGVGRNTYQADPFVGSSDLQLAYHPRLNQWSGMFLVACLDKSIERYNYSFAWKRNGEAFKAETVFLPATPAGDPDWDYMEQTMRDFFAQQERNLDELTDLSSSPLKTVSADTWRTFQIDELFEVVKGTRLTKSQMLPGTIRHIGASQFDNGVTAMISNSDAVHPGNLLTVCYDGPVGTTFYQPEEFWATDAVNVLYPRFELTPAIGMYLVPVIQEAGASFNYGEKWGSAVMKVTPIFLPVTTAGDPDWNYMEQKMSQVLAERVAALDSLQELVSEV